MRGLYAMFQRHQEFVEDPDSSHDICVRSTNAGVQVALAICRVKELHELEQEMQAFEHLTNNGNGHRA